MLNRAGGGVWTMTKKKHVAETLHKHNRRKVNRFFELLDLPVEAGIE
jgi:hypothetical protein